jgi:hypothetical protein
VLAICAIADRRQLAGGKPRGQQTAQQLTMYTTTSCASCAQLKSALAAAGIEFAEVDVENELAAS